MGCGASKETTQVSATAHVPSNRPRVQTPGDKKNIPEQEILQKNAQIIGEERPKEIQAVTRNPSPRKRRPVSAGTQSIRSSTSSTSKRSSSASVHNEKVGKESESEIENEQEKDEKQKRKQKKEKQPEQAEEKRKEKEKKDNETKSSSSTESDTELPSTPTSASSSKALVTREPELHPGHQNDNSAPPFNDQFPTPVLLAEAQAHYFKQGVQILMDENNHRPLPYPTPTAKKDVFDLKAYQNLDLHAVESPIELIMADIGDLVQHLIKPTKSNMERLRVIFRWITAQDINSFNFGSTEPPDNTAGWHLKGIRDKSGDYSSLLIEMCKRADLECVKIAGTVKGTSYNIGEAFPHDPEGINPFFGTWVAVLVDGVWRIVDPHWASRHVTGGNEGGWALVDDGCGKQEQLTVQEERLGHLQYSYDEFFFLTDPYNFVYGHLPYDPQWQLLARPVSVKEFEEMAYLKQTFFDIGLQIISHPKCVIQVPDGETKIEIGLSKTKKCNTSHKLYIFAGKDTSLDFGNIKLERYVFSEIFQGVLSLQITFPISGKYKLELFGKDANEEGNVRHELCKYMLNCSKPKTGVKPLPETQRGQWGPGNDTEEVGMHPLTHEHGRVEAEEDGTTEIRFKLDKKTEFLHHLTNNEKSKTELEKYVVHRVEKGEAIFNVKLPDDGDYALSLFAKEEGSEGAFTNVCDYLIHAENGADDPTPFPAPANGRLGPLEDFKKYGLYNMTHESGIIDAPESGELKIMFGTKWPMEFLVKLNLQVDDDKMEEFSEFTFQEQNENNATFSMVFPKPGMYKLSIYGKPALEEGSSLPLLSNYIIHARWHKKNCFPFPKTFGVWGLGCQLISPQSGYLEENSTKSFGVRIPKAEDVATIGAHGWTHLEKDELGIWRGEVQTGPGGNDLKLSACVEPGTQSFSTFLLFKVMGAVEEEQQGQLHADAEAAFEHRKDRHQKKPESVKEESPNVTEGTAKENKQLLHTLVEQLMSQSTLYSELTADLQKTRQLRNDIKEGYAKNQLLLANIQANLSTLSDERKYLDEALADLQSKLEKGEGDVEQIKSEEGELRIKLGDLLEQQERLQQEKAKFIAEHVSLTKKAADYETQMAHIEEKQLELNDEKLESEYETLVQQSKDYNDDEMKAILEQLRKIYDEMREMRMLLQNERQQTRDDEKTIRTSLTCASEVVQELESNIDILIEEGSGQECRLQNMSSMINARQTENIREDLLTVTKQCQEQQNRWQDLTGRCSSMQPKYEELSKNEHDLVTSIDDFSARNSMKEINEQIYEAMTILEEQVETSADEVDTKLINEVQIQLERLMTGKDNVHNHAENMRNILEQLNEISQSFSHLHMDLEELQKSWEELQQTYSALQEKCDGNQQDAEKTLETEFQQTEKCVTEFQNSFGTFLTMDQLTFVQNRLDADNDIAKQLESLKQEYETSLTSKQEQLDSLLNRYRKKQKEEAESKRQEKMVSLQQQIDGIKEQLSSIASGNEEVIKKIEEIKEEELKIKDQLDSSKENASSLEERFYNMKYSRETIEEQIETLKDEFAKLSQRRDDGEDILTLVSEYERLKEEENQLIQQADGMEQMKNKLNEDCIQFKQDCELCSEKFKAMLNEQENLRQKKEELSKQLEELKNSLTEVKQGFEQIEEQPDVTEIEEDVERILSSVNSTEIEGTDSVDGASEIENLQRSINDQLDEQSKIDTDDQKLQEKLTEFIASHEPLGNELYHQKEVHDEEQRVKQEAEMRRQEEERLRQEREEEERRMKEEAERLVKEADEARRQAEEMERKMKEAKDEEEKKKMEQMRNEMRQRMIRGMLHAAMKANNRHELEKVVAEYKKHNIPEQNGELTDALGVIEFLKAKEALESAMSRRDLKDLKKAMQEIENRGFHSRLKPEMMQARYMVESLERIEKLRHSILNMDAKTMGEIRSYREPPLVVHNIMVASLLILGENERKTRDWKSCQKLCKVIDKDGLLARVRQFNIHTLHPEIAARAKQILVAHRLDDVRAVSAGAATFYVWGLGMAEEVLTESSYAGIDVKPADRARQKEIFSGHF